MPMKTLIMAVVAFMMMVTTAFAEVRVFTQASGPGIDSFVEQLTASELIADGRFPSVVLGVIAYDFAAANGHLEKVPASNRDQASYANLFVRWNGLRDTMSLQQFQQKGQGTGFWLPVTMTGGSSSTTVPASAAADIVNAALEARGLAPLEAFTKLQAAQLTEGDVKTILWSELGNQAVPQSFIAAVGRVVDPELKAFSERLDAVDEEMKAIPKQLATINAALFDADGNVRFVTKNEVSSTVSKALTEAGLVDEQGKAIVSATPWGLIAWLAALTVVVMAIGLALTRVRRTAGESTQSITDLADSRVELYSKNPTLEDLKGLAPGESRFWKARVGDKDYRVMIWKKAGDAPGLVRTNLYRSPRSPERVLDTFALKRGFEEKLRRAIFEGRAEADTLPFVKAKAA